LQWHLEYIGRLLRGAKLKFSLLGKSAKAVLCNRFWIIASAIVACDGLQRHTSSRDRERRLATPSTPAGSSNAVP